MMNDSTPAHCHPVVRLAATTPTPGDGTDGRSGWCGRGAHHRCIGAYDVPCGCVCHQDPVGAAAIGAAAAFERLMAGGGVLVVHQTFRWSEVDQLLEVTDEAGPRRFTLAEFGEVLDAAWGHDRTR